MISSRKKGFLRLCRLLRAIEADRDDLASVKALNLGLLKEILRDEGYLLRLRADHKALKAILKTGRLVKADAARLRKRMAGLELRIKRYNDQIYVWRCLGDGLAYAYIASFNIKHVFFNTTHMGPKADAGFITGKSGLEREVAILKSAIDHRVPAVLSDITNIVRYGDLCLLGGPDPVPIEVKSSKGLNQRGHRQVAKLQTLNAFLETDRAENFRGAPSVSRASCHEPYRDHQEAFNQCLETAHRDGQCLLQPEEGLAYVALCGDQNVDGLLVQLQMERPTMFLLNTEKREHNWAPYLPFVNSIRDLERLYDFVVGNVVVLVVLDVANLCRRFAMPGWRVAFVDDGDLAIVFQHPASGAQFALSRQYVGRIGFEFAAIDWMTAGEQNFVRQTLGDALEPIDGHPSEGAPVDEEFIEAMTARLNGLPRVYETEVMP